MGRPKLDETMETVSARLPREMVERLDRFLDSLRAELPLLILNRADAVRQLLAMGLEVAEAKQPKSKKLS
jgi:hypothetical protein